MDRVRRLALAIIAAWLTGAAGGAAGPTSSAAPPADLGTDRDAFTPAADTVGAGQGLVEGSYVFIDNLSGLPTNNYPELLVRIGATDRFEWRLGANYGVGSQGNVVTSVEVGEGAVGAAAGFESSLLYGFKAAVSDQAGLVPESCFIMEASTPTYGEIFGTVPVATLVAGWELPAGPRLDTAIRYAYAEAEEAWFSRWTPSVVLRKPVTGRWEVHAEYFESLTQGLVTDTRRGFFSPGTHILLTDRCEVGVRVGWGVTADAAPFFSDAGFGYRW